MLEPAYKVIGVTPYHSALVTKKRLRAMYNARATGNTYATDAASSLRLSFFPPPLPQQHPMMAAPGHHGQAHAMMAMPPTMQGPLRGQMPGQVCGA